MADEYGVVGFFIFVAVGIHPTDYGQPVGYSIPASKVKPRRTAVCKGKGMIVLLL
jgi:hypothetical protein